MKNIDVIEKIAQKSISLCATKEQLLREEKLWNKYFALMNKFLAGKCNMPYFDDEGGVSCD